RRPALDVQRQRPAHRPHACRAGDDRLEQRVRREHPGLVIRDALLLRDRDQPVLQRVQHRRLPGRAWLTMFASALPKLAAALLQPPALAAGLVTGIVSGAVGVGTGAIPVTDPGPRLNTLYECPGSGRVVANLAPDQKVLVTARSADGAWLQIYVGEPGVERGWASAAKLHLAAAPDSLPIADCTPEPTPETSLELPSALPSPEATVVATVVPTAVPVTLPPGATPNPTPKPTATPKPTKTPTPTPTPFVGPTVSHLEINYADPQGG